MLTKNILQAHPSITITAIKNKSLELVDGDSSDNFPDSEFPVDTELVEYDESSMFSEDGESSNFRLGCLRLPENSSRLKGVFLFAKRDFKPRTEGQCSRGTISHSQYLSLKGSESYHKGCGNKSVDLRFSESIQICFCILYL